MGNSHCRALCSFRITKNMLIKLTWKNVDPLETFKHQKHVIKSVKLKTESVVNINGTLLV